MSFALTDTEMTSLTDDQKTAVMESLLVAVLADGKAEPAEVAQFDRAVDAIPWGLERPALATAMQAARSRILALKGEGQVLTFIGGVAAGLPSPEIRNKVFHAMCAIMATGDLNTSEKNIVYAFAMAFRVSLDQLAAIKADIGH